ncbi:MAG TPA: DUF1990 domain-containing protein [Anaerolineae bacterium]
MYFFKKPSQTTIQQFIQQQSELPFTYPTVGATRHPPPEGYRVDHNRIRLGCGAEAFAQARAALSEWEMFNLGWVQLHRLHSPIQAGLTVAVLVRAVGLWSLNACRVVYTVDEVGPVERFGFAYGTLPDHAERGEERFTVEWHHHDDTVWYDILAFSRPNQFLSGLAYPLVRQLQKRFAGDSLAVMHRAVNREIQL